MGTCLRGQRGDHVYGAPAVSQNVRKAELGRLSELPRVTGQQIWKIEPSFSDTRPQGHDRECQLCGRRCVVHVLMLTYVILMTTCEAGRVVILIFQKGDLRVIEVQKQVASSRVRMIMTFVVMVVTVVVTANIYVMLALCPALSQVL